MFCSYFFLILWKQNNILNFHLVFPVKRLPRSYFTFCNFKWTVVTLQGEITRETFGWGLLIRGWECPSLRNLYVARPQKMDHRRWVCQCSGQTDGQLLRGLLDAARLQSCRFRFLSESVEEFSRILFETRGRAGKLARRRLWNLDSLSGQMR